MPTLGLDRVELLRISLLKHANALIADGQKAIHFAGTEAREQFKIDAKYEFEQGQGCATPPLTVGKWP